MFCPIKNCTHVKKLTDDTFINVIKEEKLPLEFDNINKVYFCEKMGKNIYTMDEQSFNNNDILLRNSKSISLNFSPSCYDDNHYWKYYEFNKLIEYLLIDKFHLIRKETLDNKVQILCFDISDKLMTMTYKSFDDPSDNENCLFKSTLDINLSSLSKDNLQALFSFKSQQELEDYITNFDIMN